MVMFLQGDRLSELLIKDAFASIQPIQFQLIKNNRFFS